MTVGPRRRGIVRYPTRPRCGATSAPDGAQEATAVNHLESVQGRRVLVTGGFGHDRRPPRRAAPRGRRGRRPRLRARRDQAVLPAPAASARARTCASWSATSATATGCMRAIEGIDVVFHCAALKHVESGEYNPFEATQTNIVGTQNVIDACLAAEVETMILTSSDKAANPTSVMGATSCVAEKLVTAANNYRGPHADDLRQRPLRQRPGLARLGARAVRPAGRGRRPGHRHRPVDDPLRDDHRPRRRARASRPPAGRPRRRGLRVQDAGRHAGRPGRGDHRRRRRPARPRPGLDRHRRRSRRGPARRPTRS